MSAYLTLKVILSSSFCGLLSTISSDVVRVDRNADSSCNHQQGTEFLVSAQLLHAGEHTFELFVKMSVQHSIPDKLTSTNSMDITTAAAMDSHAPVKVASVRSLQQQR
jgi:hypothetical protein